MGKTSAVIHIAPSMPHQVAYAEHFAKGFKSLCISPTITGDIRLDGDIHVVIGPHYAKHQWINHSRTILVDRAFWGDPECVSIGWLNPDGGRKYPQKMDDAREKPDLMPQKTGRKVIELEDYGVKTTGDHPVRRHPLGKPCRALEDELSEYDTAIGHNTTALVTAAIIGLRVVTAKTCAAYPVSLGVQSTSREQWLNDISYANWYNHEIASGDAVEFLLNDNFGQRP